MCKVLRVDVYCDNEIHGKLPLGEDNSELNQDEKDVLQRALVQQCRSAITCQRGKYCFEDPELQKTAERDEKVVYMRWTYGSCWECTWNFTAPDSIRNWESTREEYLKVTGKPVPAVGEGPLDSRVVEELSKIEWSSQTESFHKVWEYLSEDLTGSSHQRVDDLRDIFHRLSRGCDGLKDVFTIADGCITCHETGKKRVIGEAMPMVHYTPRLEREGENIHGNQRCKMCGWIEPYFP
ncbi:hypothetical protein LQW54_010775 [Pestalotiopsis sp. IQ-011]